MGIEGALKQALGLWRIVLPAMFFGCLIGNWIQGTRMWQACSRLMAPIVRVARLPDNCGIYLPMCFINQYAANAYLGGEFQSGSLRSKELLAAFLIGGFPNGLHFALFYIAPILIGSVGWAVGAAYTALYLVIGLATASVGILIGWQASKKSARLADVRLQAENRVVREQRTFAVLLHLTWGQFRRMALIFVPVTLIFALGMHHAKTVQWLASADRLFSSIGLSGPVVIVVVAGLPSSISGLAAAGALYQNGLLGPVEVVYSLLIAYGLHVLYEFGTNYIPSTVAFFGPKQGLRVSVFHLIIRLSAISVALIFIFLFTI